MGDWAVRGLQLLFGFVRTPERNTVGDDGLGGLADLAREHLKPLRLWRLVRDFRLHWNPRMRTTAGRATWPDGLVELNPALQDFGAVELERTLLHELAHLVAYERAGRRRIRPHGEEWQQACADLGIPGESASHRLALPGVRARWLYTCPHCASSHHRVRRRRRPSACWPCCRTHSGGEYDDRFRFLEEALDECPEGA